MITRIGWALYVVGLAGTAAGLFLFPWLSSGPHGCYAVVGGSCTIANGNTSAALVLLAAAAVIGVVRLRTGTPSPATSIGLAAAGTGLAFGVFTFSYDSFTGPSLIFTAPPTRAQMRELMQYSDWSPSTGFALTLLGSAFLIGAAVLLSFGGAPSKEADGVRRRRFVAAATGITAALLALLGAWLPWVHMPSGPTVLDTDPSTVGVAAAALLIAAGGYLLVGGRGWMSVFAVSAGILCSIGVYQWLQLRWQTHDILSYNVHATLAAGIWLSLAAAVLGAAAATVALVEQPSRRERGAVATAGAFIVALLVVALASNAIVDSRTPSCGGTGYITVENGHTLDTCGSTLYEGAP